MRQRACQVLIIGAGITGLTIARELVKRGAEDILIIEKENNLGFHASGRNSGVLHAGIYYRSVALSEPKKYWRRFFFAEAGKLIPELRLEDLEEADKVGIRSQLVHWPSKKLVMDFVMLKDGDSLHILNPISPAFTSSMAFAEYVVGILLGEKEEF